MDTEDIIYVICLLGCILFGSYYKYIENEAEKKRIGTAVGLLIIFVVSGVHIIHILVSFLIGALIVTRVPKEKCHIASFVFMFGFLLFFRTTTYFGIPDPPGQTNMIQMILTLKLVGLAFEINTQYNELKTASDNDKQNSALEQTSLMNLTLEDVLHYSFNYIGVLTGPYYRYRTFNDYFELPFKKYIETYNITMEKMKWIALYSSLYLITTYIWPLHYAMSDEFYSERGFWYRLFYIWPTFFIFRMRIYIGLTLSEAVCTNAGFGAYPDAVESVSGEGPKSDYLQYKNIAEKQTYNFNTIKNLNIRGTETCWTFREAMKTWNICVQYWLAVNIYRRFPSKKYRTAVTLLVSAFWHGVYAGHYFCIMGAPLYVPIEDIYHKVYRKYATGQRRQIIDALFWLSKFFSLSYLGTSFVLLHFDKIWRFYSSVYHVGYVYWAILLIVGICISKQKQMSEKRNLDNTSKEKLLKSQ